MSESKTERAGNRFSPQESGALAIIGERFWAVAPDLSKSEILVFMLYAMRCPEGGEAWQSRAGIAELLGCDQATVRRARKGLVERGLLIETAASTALAPARFRVANTRGLFRPYRGEASAPPHPGKGGGISAPPEEAPAPPEGGHERLPKDNVKGNEKGEPAAPAAAAPAQEEKKPKSVGGYLRWPDQIANTQHQIQKRMIDAGKALGTLSKPTAKEMGIKAGLGLRATEYLNAGRSAELNEDGFWADLVAELDERDSLEPSWAYRAILDKLDNRLHEKRKAGKAPQTGEESHRVKLIKAMNQLQLEIDATRDAYRRSSDEAIKADLAESGKALAAKLTGWEAVIERGDPDEIAEAVAAI